MLDHVVKQNVQLINIKMKQESLVVKTVLRVLKVVLEQVHVHLHVLLHLQMLLMLKVEIMVVDVGTLVKVLSVKILIFTGNIIVVLLQLVEVESLSHIVDIVGTGEDKDLECVTITQILVHTSAIYGKDVIHLKHIIIILFILLVEHSVLTQHKNGIIIGHQNMELLPYVMVLNVAKE